MKNEQLRNTLWTKVWQVGHEGLRKDLQIPLFVYNYKNQNREQCSVKKLDFKEGGYEQYKYTTHTDVVKVS